VYDDYFFFHPSECFEFCFPRVEDGSLRECVRQVSERRIVNFLLSFFIQMFSSFGFVYDERSVATTMNEPAIVTSENATDNIQKNVHDRNPFNLNCRTMIFRFLHFVICIVHCFFLFLDFLQVSACQFVYLISCLRANECDFTMCSSVFERLPCEMIVKIFSYVTQDDLCGNVRLVCQRFNALSYDASLWGEVSFTALPLSLDQ
jgi:hypothetical protein